jgi:hypothetical protein
MLPTCIWQGFTQQQREKVAGTASSDLRPIMDKLQLVVGAQTKIAQSVLEPKLDQDPVVI